jgi:hypothetical protein
MKRFGLIIFALMTIAFPFQKFVGGQQLSNFKNKEVLIFEGEVEKVGTSPGAVSGGIEVYQLAKYKVNRNCEGLL